MWHGLKAFSKESRVKRDPWILAPAERHIASPSSPCTKRKNAHLYDTLASAPCPFRTPLVICMIYYQPVSSSKFGIRVCNSVPSYNDLCTCYVTYLLLMYICLGRENEVREKKKKKRKKKKEKGRWRHSATFPLTNIGLFFLLSAAQIPQRGSKYD